MNSNLTDSEVLELSALCSALIDGAITATERARLEAWLAESESARRYYVRAMALSASLCDYANEMQAEAPDLATRIVRPASWKWAIGTLAAAASVALAFWFGMKEPDASRGPTVAEVEIDETVARLSGAKDVQWVGEAIRTGEELRRGQRLEITSGVAEITFDSGARVTVEGPASVDLTSAWEAALHHGTLRAHVPTEAIGFRVSNPEVDVVDLGTEFTMVADVKGGTEVFVLQGAVEVAPRDSGEREPMVLREKQARRFAKSGVSEVVDRDQKVDRLVRKISFERLMRPASYVRWGFDKEDGNVARAEIFGAARGSLDLQMSAMPLRVEGRWHEAFEFDGALSGRVSFPGIGQRRARTIAFWVQAPGDAQLPESGSLLAWPLNGKEPRGVEVAWNRNPNQGPLGALRTRVGRGSFVGSTPVRDGRWHHVAVVYLPKPKSDANAQVKHNVDGRLDTVSWKHSARKVPGESPEVASAADETLWIGQGLGEGAERFRGRLDEVFVADRALTPHEIRYLMMHNAPAPTEMLAVE
jgi:ferric-dicitrate binding protein FerR (iron transport regulator)